MPATFDVAEPMGVRFNEDSNPPRRATMPSRLLFRIHAVVALVYGVWLVLHPSSLHTLYGADATDTVLDITRQLGATFLTFAATCWLARDARPGPALSAILKGMTVGLVVGFFCSLNVQLAGRVGPLHWSAVATWLLLALGYASSVLRGDDDRSQPL